MKKHIKDLARVEWLLEHEREEGDVMKDDDGREYIMEEPGEGEMEDGMMTEFPAQKIYLPDFEKMILEAKRLAQHND